MEPSQLRSLFGASVVLLALTALLAFWEPAEVDFEPEATAEVVAPTDPTRAVGIRIVQAAGERQDTVVLEKQDGIWRVREPFQADADVDRVVAVLDAVRESTRGVPLEGSPATFGLDPPQATVTVTMEDGSSRLLRLGSVAPVGWQTYALAMDGRVVAVSGKPGDDVLIRAGEFRDHQIFRFDPGDVTRLTITRQDHELDVQRTDDGWFVTGFGRADLVELDFLITELLKLRVSLFLDLDHETIADPRYVVRVETPAGVQEMRVGRDTPYGPLVFWADGLDGVVEPPMLGPLDRGPKRIAAHEAFPTFRDDRTTAIALSGAVDVRLERPDGGWGEHPWAVALRDAQVIQDYAPADWGSAELTVTLEGEGAAVVDVGPADAEGMRAVRDRAGGVAQRVPAEELAALFAPAP